VPVVNEEPLARELADFVDAAVTRRPPLVTGEDGRRALADPSRPLEPSAFFGAALAPATPGEAPEIAHTRTLVEPVLAALESDVQPRRRARTWRWCCRSRCAPCSGCRSTC
jgi:hypothetical protein